MKAARQEAGLIWQLNLSGKGNNDEKPREDKEVNESNEKKSEADKAVKESKEENSREDKAVLEAKEVRMKEQQVYKNSSRRKVRMRACVLNKMTN